MPRMILERERRPGVFRNREDICSHRELLETVIFFKEVFCYIFRNATNPSVEIEATDPGTDESFVFIISTKYQRYTSSAIRRGYWMLQKKYAFLEEFENIAAVTIKAKGTQHKEQQIYSNSSTPWNNTAKVINFPLSPGQEE